MLDSFQCRRTLAVNNKTYHYFDLKIAEQAGLKGLSKLPFSLKILIENLLRHEDGKVASNGYKLICRFFSISRMNFSL